MKTFGNESGNSWSNDSIRFVEIMNMIENGRIFLKYKVKLHKRLQTK